ncbi:hypothetical protein NDU88_007189 [Pleurodeles waltl]|uniref:Uncharacterized protein n=1 Tax=Pleurodeles waltl TaxID=8319 RepID=A0AAV7LU36_PLEWA|nr:hypothetical protein NDU88_007189 [Pleurodeles waltl]
MPAGAGQRASRDQVSAHLHGAKRGSTEDLDNTMPAAVIPSGGVDAVYPQVCCRGRTLYKESSLRPADRSATRQLFGWSVPSTIALQGGVTLDRAGAVSGESRGATVP